KSFLFLLEEKIRRAQKKSRENFFAGWRALASGGGANQPFRSKKVRAKCKNCRIDNLLVLLTRMLDVEL
ncbi:hypothetical protein KGQ27_03820, partial [Patescibacteria group bacterium]|nr:hypothetical protein [Patescibacteria group bacterium]MDE2011212.1 hypothetical protein [Patescibacteria group bacterium]